MACQQEPAEHIGLFSKADLAMNVEGHQVNSLESSRSISAKKKCVFEALHVTALFGTDDVQTV